MIERANSMRGPLQPKLTLQDAKRIVRGTVGSALARAQQIYGTRLFTAVTMVWLLHFHNFSLDWLPSGFLGILTISINGKEAVKTRYAI